MSLGLAEAMSIYTYDQSTLDVENVNFTGVSSGFRVVSRDSSVVDIVNVSATGGAPASVYSYDLSVMNISSSTMTTIGYAVKSTGNMEVINDVIGGSYVKTTTWDGIPVSAPYPISIAVVGTHTATITNSTLSSLGVTTVYLHNKANLNTQNSTINLVYTHDSTTLNAIDTTFDETSRLYDTSTLSGTNITLPMNSNLRVCDQSSASLSNITSAIMSSIFVRDSATLTCTGNASAPSNLYSVSAQSNYPNMANVVINNCTVGGVTGSTWIPQAPILPPALPLLIFLQNFSLQSQQFTFYLLVGGGIVAILAVAATIVLWRRRA